MVQNYSLISLIYCYICRPSPTSTCSSMVVHRLNLVVHYLNPFIHHLNLFDSCLHPVVYPPPPPPTRQDVHLGVIMICIQVDANNAPPSIVSATFARRKLDMWCEYVKVGEFPRPHFITTPPPPLPRPMQPWLSTVNHH